PGHLRVHAEGQPLLPRWPPFSPPPSTPPPPLEPRAADRSRPSTDTGRRVRAALRDRGARRERDVTRPIGVIAQPAEGPGRAIEQFEAYFEAAADGVVVTDADAN